MKNIITPLAIVLCLLKCQLVLGVQNHQIQISGVYPHLTSYGLYSQNGAHLRNGHNEAGIGAVVPWADKLWWITYAPHRPQGSEHKLYSMGADLKVIIHSESVGGTPAGRMIHRESNQLLIGPYVINSEGKIRAITPAKMPGRLTAIARHLSDPKNKVYYYDMEGMLYEADVRTLDVKKLFQKPVPGWHGKGAYTSQNRLIVSNNGGLKVHKTRPDFDPKTPEEAGVLAEWDGQAWTIVERRQYTDITGPDGIFGGQTGDEPVWAIGWDRRSLRLKLLDKDKWYTFLLPKAAHNNDPLHGWYTEWPRIREIGRDKLLMDMHGMFFGFPKTFSNSDTGGIKPIASHLRYVPDFCNWNGCLVIATDETSIQENHLAGQPQSNFWFGDFDELENWGPCSAYGGPWIADPIKAGEYSDPFLVAGFDRLVLHLSRDKSAIDSKHSLDDVNPQETDAPEDTDANEKVNFTVQIDRVGNGRWEDYQAIQVPAKGYLPFVFPADFKSTWIRLKADKHCIATAYFHLTDNHFHDGSAADTQKLFAGLANIDEDVIGGSIYAAKRNRNLRMIRSDGKFFEFQKDSFEFKPDKTDQQLQKLLETKSEFIVDDASVIVRHGNVNLRLPKGDDIFDQSFDGFHPRNSREVESERQLANIHGTFYEVPLRTNGSPPAFDLMRPVASHNKMIFDFCSWNGLLVISGVNPNAANDGHVWIDHKNKIGLWFGGIDDLWKLGKPVGIGGPWKNSRVQAGQISDPYLMKGYDKKTLVLESDVDNQIVIEVDIDHQSGWKKFETMTLKAGTISEFTFPQAYSANWIRFRAMDKGMVSATLIYE